MNDPSQLLRVLGSGVRPVSPTSPSQPAGSVASGIEHASFDQLLSAARTQAGTLGGVASGREVSVADEAGLSLTPELADRLSLAADRAEAAGIRKAVVLLDGGAYTLDVPTRTITAKAAGDKGIYAEVDGLVDLRSTAADAAEAATVLSTAALKLGNASLMDLLTKAVNSEH